MLPYFGHIGCPGPVIMSSPDTTDRASTPAEHFDEMGEASDARVAETINGFNVDVLVFLDGHNSGSRIALLALDVAPVQASLHAPNPSPPVSLCCDILMQL